MTTSAVLTRRQRSYPDVASPWVDNHDRIINYVRLAVTDVCNLRCSYCMPENMRFLPRKSLLTWTEMERLVNLLATMGVTKVRITGGEPFVRPGLMPFLGSLVKTPGIERVHITTNGVETAPHVPALKALGIAGINLSLDTLDRERFRQITRRDAFERVMRCYETILDHDIPLRINMVVMEGHNEQDILPMSELAREHPVSVRFIEEMPFNGTAQSRDRLKWNYRRILAGLREAYPDMVALPGEPAATALRFGVPGYRGTLGVIPAYSRTFCGACNRIRITAAGRLQTCLYAESDFSLRDHLRSGAGDAQLEQLLRQRVGNRFIDGIAAQQHRSGGVRITESMSQIGG